QSEPPSGYLSESLRQDQDVHLKTADLQKLLQELPFSNVHLDLAEGSLKDSLMAVLTAHKGRDPLLVSQPLVLKGPAWDLHPSGLIAFNDTLLAELALLTGRQARQQGTDMLIAPALEGLMTGENRRLYATRLHQFQVALEEEGVLLGAGPVRPYYPLVRDTARRDSIMAPLRDLGRGGVASVWVDSLTLNAIHLNSRKEEIIQRYLQEFGSFQGILMGEVQPESPADLAEAVRKMVKAGLDVIYARPDRIRETYAQLKDLQLRSTLSEEVLAQKNKSLLMARYWHEADSFASLKVEPLLAYQLAHAGLTLLRAEQGKLPLGAIEQDSIRVWVVGDSVSGFEARMKRYGPVAFRYMEAPSFLGLEKFPDIWAWNEAIPGKASIRFFQQLAEEKPGQILVHFGNPQPLMALAGGMEVLHHYGTSVQEQDLVAQAVWGGATPDGIAPFSWNESLAFGQTATYPRVRLGFGLPNLVEMDPAVLTGIDTIVQEGLEAFAMPGAQVLVARKGQIVYDRSFGYQTYAEREAISPSALYDIASVTKVAATTLATMYSYSQGDLRLDQPLSDFFGNPYFKVAAVDMRDTLWVSVDSLQQAEPQLIHQAAQRSGTFSADTTIEGDSARIVRRYQRKAQTLRSRVFDLPLSELLTHTSGLPAGLPILDYMYYRDSVTGRYDRYYAPNGDSVYPVSVARRMYLRADYQDSIWQDVKGMSMDPEKRYMYSDANMILVQRALDSLHGEPLNEFLDRELYGPLGMSRTLFRPLTRFDGEEIVPTEQDNGWRGQLLRGHVHDPTAALMGGVSGNAGLFSNATDLAHLFQMLLNQGHYGGKRYLSPATVRRFTQAQAGHRGFGFDKPPRNGAYIIGEMASPDSYGHTGFTGTCVWVDPQQELIYIFLSNRVHPNPKNWKLNSLEIRQRIHDVVYASIGMEIAKED
ncbi:MAG: serine hydrolase, partial [Bacteroidota bacterium]